MRKIAHLGSPLGGSVRVRSLKRRTWGDLEVESCRVERLAYEDTLRRLRAERATAVTFDDYFKLLDAGEIARNATSSVFVPRILPAQRKKGA